MDDTFEPTGALLLSVASSLRHYCMLMMMTAATVKSFATLCETQKHFVLFWYKHACRCCWCRWRANNFSQRRAEQQVEREFYVSAHAFLLRGNFWSTHFYNALATFSYHTDAPNAWILSPLFLPVWCTYEKALAWFRVDFASNRRWPVQIVYYYWHYEFVSSRYSISPILKFCLFFIFSRSSPLFRIPT